MKEVKKWKVEYNHNNGRQGTTEAITEIMESGCFTYGNRKCGALIIRDYEYGYDLRYCTAKDLHMVMLEDYFGSGLIKATEL